MPRLPLPETPPLPNRDFVAIDPPTPPAPVIRAARFARNASLQPSYPTIMLRAEIEGSVTVRVHIDTNGRVIEVQRVHADHDAFFDATRRHALRNWRFEPATRDGRPVDSWQQHTVTFRIT